jgi:hypothetical protein
LSPHPRPVTFAAFLAATAVIVASLAVSAAASTPAAKLKIDDACTFVTEQQIADAFGEPVEFLPVHFVGSFDCVWEVKGGTSAGGGRFQTYQLYPNFAVGLESARSAYVDERAIDTLSESNLKEIEGVGQAAFINYTENHITVLANKKLAFTLIWEDADAASELAKSDAKKLIALAKKVVRRASK